MRPLGLFAVMAAALCAVPLQDDTYTLSTGQPCPLEGSAIPMEIKALNRLKNRSATPTPTPSTST